VEKRPPGGVSEAASAEPDIAEWANGQRQRNPGGADAAIAGAYAKAEEQYRAILQVSPDENEAQIGLAAALRGQLQETQERLDFAERMLARAEPPRELQP